MAEGGRRLGRWVRRAGGEPEHGPARPRRGLFEELPPALVFASEASEGPALVTLTTNERHRARRRLRLVALVIILVPVALTAPACSPSKADIEQEIEAASACPGTDLCVDVGGICPFDCVVPVNQREAERIRKLMEDFDSSCVDACPSGGKEGVFAICSDGKCTSVTVPP